MGPVRAARPRSSPTTSGPAATPIVKLPGAGDRDRDQPDQDAERQPDGQAHGVQVAWAALGVAQIPRDVGEAAARGDDADPVALLDDEIRCRQQVDVAAADPRRHGAEPISEPQPRDGAPGKPGVRDHHPAHVEVVPVERQVVLAVDADALADEADRVRVSDHGHQVTARQRRPLVRDAQLVSVLAPGHEHGVLGIADQRAHLGCVLAGHLDGHAHDRVGAARLRTAPGNLRRPAERPPGEAEHDEDPRQVGDGVAHRRRGGAVELLGRGGECGRVGERARVDARDLAATQSQGGADQGRHEARGHEDRAHAGDDRGAAA